MEKIQFSKKISDMQVDALIGNSIYQYKARVGDVRVLQSELLKLGKILTELPYYSGVLILDDLIISKSRLAEEWTDLSNVLKSSILARLSLVIITNGIYTEHYGKLSKEQIKGIPPILEKISKKNKFKLRKPDAFFEILRILLINWFRKSGSLKLNQLTKISGFSYPTVAAALEKMEMKLIRHSDRSVELKSFPRDEWFKLLAVKDEIRKSTGFLSRQPRPIKTLIEKIIRKNNEDIAFGGIVGARFYLPGIDIIGIHRLDLTVVKWNFNKVEKLIHSLDPGLERIKPGEVPQVVVHNLYCHTSFFNKSDKLQIADEVECLLDLHDARLEPQALELLDYLKNKAKQ